MPREPLQVGQVYGDYDRRTIHVVFASLQGDVVLECYEAPCEVPADGQVHHFKTQEEAIRFVDRTGVFLYEDELAPVEHVVRAIMDGRMIP